MRVLAYVTLLCTTMIATAQCMDGTDPHSPYSSKKHHVEWHPISEEGISGSSYFEEGTVMSEEKAALSGFSSSGWLPHFRFFDFAGINLINALHLLSIPEEHIQTSINFALIPQALLPWIQRSGVPLSIENTYNFPFAPDSSLQAPTDDSAFAQRARTAIDTQNEVEAEILFDAFVDYRFALANPVPKRIMDTYWIERTLLFNDIEFTDGYIFLEADFRITSTDPQCMGMHSITVSVQIEYDESLYAGETDDVGEANDEETSDGEYNDHDDDPDELVHPTNDEEMSQVENSTFVFMRGAEESTTITISKTLSPEFDTVFISFQETAPCFDRLSRVTVVIQMSTKCPEAIQIDKLVHEIRFLDPVHYEGVIRTNIGRIPMSALPQFIFPKESTNLHNAYLGRRHVSISTVTNAQLVQTLQLHSMAPSFPCDISFYILPKRRPGSNTWSIWFGAVAHIDYRGSVKITLSCPAKATQLHLQNVDQTRYMVFGYNRMTGFFHDKHRPDEHACDEVLVQFTFPRPYPLTVSDMFFLCDDEPCEYRSFQSVTTRPDCVLLPHLNRRARESGRVTASGTHTSQSALHRGECMRPKRWVIGLGVALSLSVLLICCITALIVFFRSRRMSSHPWRYAAVNSLKTDVYEIDGPEEHDGCEMEQRHEFHREG